MRQLTTIVASTLFMLALALTMRYSYVSAQTVEPTAIIPPSTEVLASTPTTEPGVATDTPIADTTPPPTIILPPTAIPPTSGPQQVIVLNTPLAITVTQPLSVSIVPRIATDEKEGASIAILFVYIMAKLLLLALFHIPQTNVFEKIYELLLTGIFIAVDILIVYPVVLNGNLLVAGGLWFVFWIVTLHIKQIIHFLTNLTTG
jgi:hypothetical protein